MLRKTLRLRILLILPLAAVTAVFAAGSTPQEAPQVVYLWPSGATTLQGAGEKEITNPPQPQPGQVIRQFKNIHNPSIEVFPPPEKATGAALIVAAGGGHRELNVGTEGYDLREWLHGLGVAVFILKYRLAFTPNYKYTVEGEALQDTQRDPHRARAKEWRVNPTRVGILGFSAGGALAALADIRFDRGKPDARPTLSSERAAARFRGPGLCRLGAFDGHHGLEGRGPGFSDQRGRR